MVAKTSHSLSHGPSRMYVVGPWFVVVNHRSRQAEITSGDIWFPITRHEAANWLRHGQPVTPDLRKAA